MFELLVFVPYLGYGGSERVLLNLVNYYANQGKNVALCILKPGGELELELNSGVHVIYLEHNKVMFSIFNVAKVIRENKSKVVFSSLWHMNVVLALAKMMTRSKSKYIARETNIVSKQSISFIKKTLIKLSYKVFDKVIAQSLDMKNDLVENFGVDKKNIVVVNNGVDIDSVNKKLQLSEKYNIYPSESINLISVGKLEPQKGYDNLIKIFFAAKFSDNVKLHLIGEGSMREDLQSLIHKYQLENQVFLLGIQSNPYAFMSEANVFISSSRFEGFPNVVIESLICGTPVVSNNYLGGINEIINPTNGKIIDFNLENVDIFKDSVIKACDYNRDKISQEAKERFSLISMMNKYNDIFKS
ncbi:hypothetical protein BIW16_11560 [Vibrio sp. OULL4]|nr:glycosyltransferase [Vibrio parahaemolyticus]MDF4708820.1 glycosyltransferase [Vibrio parahaemolyticus]MDF5573015.1 glycosyltransferase [Vibrio parahaemolyticus]MDG2900500.1 glycosyltransferase [Vibrio parahaemolyticus]OOI02273.1 hypothetical protein BIW16_11560 [Vibrio sp. OULL4]